MDESGCFVFPAKKKNLKLIKFLSEPTGTRLGLRKIWVKNETDNNLNMKTLAMRIKLLL